jgi:site-specific DNA-methyltransferase (cytosine-N4-specific)
MLTNSGDLVIDPFAGSCVTGEVADRLKRKWICVEIVEDYLKGAVARFQRENTLFPISKKRNNASNYYKIHHPASAWTCEDEASQLLDGGRNRPGRKTK